MASRGLLICCLALGLGLALVESARLHEHFARVSHQIEAAEQSAPEEQHPKSVEVPGKESKEESTLDFSEHEGEKEVSGDFAGDAEPWWQKPQFDEHERVTSHSRSGSSAGDRFASSMDPRFFTNHRYSRSGFDRYGGNPNPETYGYLPYSKMSDQEQQQQTSWGGCSTEYWVSNIQSWPSFFHPDSTLKEAFGSRAAQAFGRLTTMMQALTDTDVDGYSLLARNGCTALLNAYTKKHFRFSHLEVIESFNAALVSNKVAARQAVEFAEANFTPMSEQYNLCT